MFLRMIALIWTPLKFSALVNSAMAQTAVTKSSFKLIEMCKYFFWVKHTHTHTIILVRGWIFSNELDNVFAPSSQPFQNFCTHCSSLVCLCFSNTGRKKKEQHDGNQAAAGLNPGYAGAYGSAPPVSFQSSTTCSLYRVKFLSALASIETNGAYKFSTRNWTFGMCCLN